MSASVMAVGGVLRKPMGQPIPEGVRLYRALTSVGRVVLLDDSPEYVQTAEWLELNGCVQHDFIDVMGGPDFAAGRTHADRANRLRREGYDITLVIEPDPGAAMELIATGFNVLLFVHAQYSRPDWRPDNPKGIIPWTAITDRVAESARLKAADSRLRNDE